MPLCFSAFVSFHAFAEEFQQLSGDKGPNNSISLFFLFQAINVSLSKSFSLLVFNLHSSSANFLSVRIFATAAGSRSVPANGALSPFSNAVAWPSGVVCAKVVEDKNMDKSKSLDAALSQIEKQFGKGSIMKLGSDGAIAEISSIPSGSLGLDIGLGIGGFPKGRVIEIYGPESSGKTTLALHALAEAQKQGGVCGFIDAEHALDPVYARNLGVNIEELLISQPDHGEQALEIADTLVRSAAVDVIVIDSVAALTPKAELDGDMGDSLPGLQARLMSQALRKLTGSISKSNCMIIFINQIRMKIGVMFGSPETTTGGNALKFYSSVRVDIRRIGAIKEREQIIGNQTRVKIVKNKVAPPFKTIEFDIMYGKGISKKGEIIDLGVEAGIVEKSGTWYSYEGERMGQGRENAKVFLEENPDISNQIELAIRESAGLVKDTEKISDVSNVSEAEENETESVASK